MSRQRKGHTRPLGTTKRVRMFEMHEEPRLGQIVYHGAVELERGFMVIGFEEIGRPGRWDLLLERIAWSDVQLRGADYGIVPYRGN